MKKYILLDIDGVMVPANSWKPPDLDADGFYRFSPVASDQLQWLLVKTAATIILTTSHRTRYSSLQWTEILRRRISAVKDVFTLDDVFNPTSTFHDPTGAVKGSEETGSPLKVHPLFVDSRLVDVAKWAEQFGSYDYVIIDDDSSLNLLAPGVKKHWVKTAPGIGLNDLAAATALEILTFGGK
ncbi:HAD domain-containing protein [Chitinophaga rhizosphaerae]|uniref:HAD domain-containing protein n=1 Tax=Chitinophaga rhizosphaerae TaxID=1864947 RepID=UPI0013DE7F5C|nr:HAD domain-containing protein [Chitinophaga rhizosphaerae]